MIEDIWVKKGRPTKTGPNQSIIQRWQWAHDQCQTELHLQGRGTHLKRRNHLLVSSEPKHTLDNLTFFNFVNFCIYSLLYCDNDKHRNIKASCLLLTALSYLFIYTHSSLKLFVFYWLCLLEDSV